MQDHVRQFCRQVDYKYASTGCGEEMIRKENTQEDHEHHMSLALNSVKY